MSLEAAPESVSDQRRGLGTISRVARRLLLVAAVDAVILLGLSAYLGGRSGWDDLDLVVAVAYSVLCPLVLAGFVVLTIEVWPQGAPVTTSGCLLFSVLFVADLIDTSSSSDMLLLLLDPVFFHFALLPFAGLSALVHRLRHQKPRRAEADAVSVV